MEDLADAVADWNRNVGGDRVTLQPWLEVLPEILKPSLPMLLWHFLHGQDAICRCSGMQHDLPLPQHRLHFAGGTRQHGKRDVQESLMPIAAAVRIQACWRAVRVRRRIQPCTRLLLRRAAIAIQRCWRACECAILGQHLGSSGLTCPSSGQPRAALGASCLSRRTEQAGPAPPSN